MLTQAAVLGRQFDVAVLGRWPDLDEEALLDAVEEALRAQVIVEAKGHHGQAVYVFAQTVVRQTSTTI